jgi:hypothetical protein
MSTLVFFLEERSARELLQGFLETRTPREWQVRYVVFEGKQDLERQLVRKLRGWTAPDTRFVVLRDQDAANCTQVKGVLADLVSSSGREAVVRVACRELEAWVLGDLTGLGRAFDAPQVVRVANQRRYRSPDAVHRPIDELRRLVPEYQKVDGARRVGPYLDPSRNESASFQAFCRGLGRIWGTSA